MTDEREPVRSNQGAQAGSSTESDHTQTFIADDTHLQAGSVLGDRYEIRKMLGMGGMGRVYQAFDLELKQEIALKVIRPDLLEQPEARERFTRELILARKVSHRNVVRIHDIGESDGHRYMSMRLISGPSIKQVVKEKGALPPEKAEEIFRQVCEAVAAAHQEGVIHRDLKPANIMLEGDDRVYVTDFGIACSHEGVDSVTRTGQVVGTPAYLAPEQLQGETADARSDIYALGLLLFELLTGKLPSRSAGVRREQLAELETETPRHLSSIIEKSLAADPRERYQTIAELIQDLDQQIVRQPERFHPVLKTAGWMLTLAAIAVVAWLAWRGLSPGPAEQPTGIVVAVLPFESTNPDPSLAWIQSAVADVLSSELSQGTNLRVLGSDRVFQTLGDLKINSYDFRSEEIRRLARIFEADMIVSGTIVSLGDGLQLDGRLIDVLNPQRPTTLKASGSPDELLSMVHQLAEQAQARLNLERKAGGRNRGTESVAALQAFHDGVSKMRGGQYGEAADAFEQALSLDSTFVRAYLSLSEAQEAVGDVSSARSTLREALSQSAAADTVGLQLAQARLDLLNGEMEPAVDIYRRLTSSPQVEPELLFEAALAFEQAGDLESAVAALERVVQADPSHPAAYFQLGKDTILMGEPEQAISRYLVKALAVATQRDDDPARADALNALGIAYERLGRYEEAIEYYQQSIVIKEKVGNKRGAATSYANIANVHLFQGRYEEAEQLLNQALKLFQELDNQRGVASIYNQFGVISEDRGNFQKALDYYRESLQIRKRLGNDRLTAESYDNIAFIYFVTGEYDNAEAFWLQALNLKESIGDERGVILSHQNMGFLQLAQGRLEQATRSFLRSLEGGRTTGFENAVAVSLGNLGTVSARKGQYQSALEYYDEALQVLTKLDDRKGLAEYNMLLGEVLLELRDYQGAQKRLTTAIELAETIGSSTIEAQTHTLWANYHRQMGETAPARLSLEESDRIAASRPGFERIKIRSELEAALLSLSEGQLSDAARKADSASNGARQISDSWLRMIADYARARIALAMSQLDQVRGIASEWIPAAADMGARSYLYRFHHLAGRSEELGGDPAEATKHYQEAIRSLAAVSEQIGTDHLDSYQSWEEVQQLLLWSEKQEGQTSRGTEAVSSRP